MVRITPINKPWSSAIWKGSHVARSLGDENDHQGYYSWDDPPSTVVVFDGISVALLVLKKSVSLCPEQPRSCKGSKNMYCLVMFHVFVFPISGLPNPENRFG